MHQTVSGAKTVYVDTVCTVFYFICYLFQISRFIITTEKTIISLYFSSVDTDIALKRNSKEKKLVIATVYFP